MRERPNWRAGLWLRRHRIRGKQKFIWSIAVARLAFPAAALVTLARVLMEPFTWRAFLIRLAANSVAAVVGGYLGGRILWDLVVNRGGRLPSETHPPRATRVRKPREPLDPRARRSEE